MQKQDSKRGVFLVSDELLFFRQNIGKNVEILQLSKDTEKNFIGYTYIVN
jgi:hypothetical protein